MNKFSEQIIQFDTVYALLQAIDKQSIRNNGLIAFQKNLSNNIQF